VRFQRLRRSALLPGTGGTGAGNEGYKFAVHVFLRMRVDLPQPLGPRMVTGSPVAMVRLMREDDGVREATLTCAMQRKGWLAASESKSFVRVNGLGGEIHSSLCSPIR